MEAIKDSGSINFAYSAAIDAAQALIQPGEKVLRAITGYVMLDADNSILAPDLLNLTDKKAGVTVLTNNRLLFIRRSLMCDITRDIPLKDIVATEQKLDTLAACLRVSSTKERWVIDGMPKVISALKEQLDTVQQAASKIHSIGICPYCDTQLQPDCDGTCPNCGGVIPLELRPQPTHQVSQITGHFCPDCGTQTESNFCPNCGRNLQSINNAVSPQTGTKQKIRITINGSDASSIHSIKIRIPSCPRCHSTDLAQTRRGFSWGVGILGFFLIPFFGLFLGFIGADKKKCTCRNCNYYWTKD